MAGPSPNPLVGATGTTFMNNGTGSYPDAFDTVAASLMPRTMPDALRWAQSIHMIDATYSQAMKRVASYFITDVEVKPYTRNGDKKLSAEESQKVVDFLEGQKIREVLNYGGENLLCYGNVFVSLLVPFTRYLACPGHKNGHKCGFEAPLEKIGNTPQFGFHWSNYEFHATCPNCHYKGQWKHVDRRGDCENEITVKFWNPHDMEILDDPLRDKQRFIWKIPEYYRRMLREGKLFHLCNANWEVIQAVKHGNHILFDDGVIHYMREKPLAGIYSGGWGLSRGIINFRQGYHKQQLMRQNEAICHEFIVPFRVLSPEPKAGADAATSDPVLGGQGGFQFRYNMQSMIKRHRRDPAQIQISPFPIKYQMLGGEANQLAPFELIDQATDALLNAAGVPAELYKGTLTMQAAPAALRLFESHWSYLVDALNGLLNFIVDRAGMLLNWEPVDAKLQKCRIADDLNRQMAVLQLMMNRNVSQTTALKALGLDFKGEQDKLLEEETYVSEKTQEVQEEEQAKQEQTGMVPTLMQQAFGQGQGQPAQGGGGGAPAQGGGGQPQGNSPTASPPELLNKADQIAQQLNQMPETQRRSELDELKKSDRTLHAVVTQRMQEQRQQQNTAGGAMIRSGQMPAKAASLTGLRLPRIPNMSDPALRDWLQRKAG